MIWAYSVVLVSVGVMPSLDRCLIEEVDCFGRLSKAVYSLPQGLQTLRLEPIIGGRIEERVDYDEYRDRLAMVKPSYPDTAKGESGGAVDSPPEAGDESG
jgi:hypothetical protein